MDKPILDARLYEEATRRGQEERALGAAPSSVR